MMTVNYGRAFTGAWVETLHGPIGTWPASRRAFTGAWVETAQAARLLAAGRVAPSQARGLKHHCGDSH